jgi:hypothetical protein
MRVGIHLSATVFVACLSLFGCSSRNYEQADADLRSLLDREFQDIFVHSDTDLTSLTLSSVAPLFSAVLRNDFPLRKFDYELQSSTIEIEQSESIVLPRVDIVIGANTSYDDGWENNPELGLVLKYDINSAIFQEDYTDVARSKRNLHIYKKKLAEKKSLFDINLLLTELFYLQREKELNDSMETIESELLLAHRKAEEIMPNMTDLHEDELEYELFQLRRKSHSLQDELERVKNIIIHRAGQKINFTELSKEYSIYLEEMEQAAQAQLENTEQRQLVVESFTVNPHTKIFENQLYLAKMNKLMAQREKIPRVRASLGGGSLLDTGTDGTSKVIVKLELIHSLFDAGETERKIRLSEISLQQTQSDIRHQFKNTVLEIRDVSHELRSAFSLLETMKLEVQRYQREYEAAVSLREERFLSSIELFQLKKSLLLKNLALLEDRQRYSRAVLRFVLVSGLQFITSDMEKKDGQAKDESV